MMPSAAPASVHSRSLHLDLAVILTVVFFAKFQYGGGVQVEVVAEMVTQKSSIQMQTQIQILALLSLSTVDHLRFVQ